MAGHLSKIHQNGNMCTECKATSWPNEHQWTQIKISLAIIISYHIISPLCPHYIYIYISIMLGQIGWILEFEQLWLQDCLFVAKSVPPKSPWLSIPKWSYVVGDLGVAHLGHLHLFPIESVLRHRIGLQHKAASHWGLVIDRLGLTSYSHGLTRVDILLIWWFTWVLICI